MTIFLALVLFVFLGLIGKLFAREPEPKRQVPVTFCVSFLSPLTGGIIPNDADCSFPNIRDI